MYYTTRLFRLLLTTIVVLLLSCGSNSGNSPLDNNGPPAVNHDQQDSSSSSSQSSDEPDIGTAPRTETCRFDFAQRHVADQLPGFRVEGNKLLDGNNNAFIMRGVNYPYAWYRQRDTAQDFTDIAASCANSVRVVLANGAQWERVDGKEVSAIIDALRERQMIAILEVHDATGWPQNENAGHPDTAIAYWLSEDIRAAIEGTENHVIINIANEPLGNFANAAEDLDNWVDFHTRAIKTLRDAGINHTLIVDAPNWGQDWTNTMRDGQAAQTVFDADTDANTVFAVHMYDVYDSPDKVLSYYEAFQEKALPLIIGEFAADHGEDKPVAIDAILEYAQMFNVGYLGWSWSGNSHDLTSLDMVLNFDAQSLSPWGERLIHGQNGIAQTSGLCTCFE